MEQNNQQGETGRLHWNVLRFSSAPIYSQQDRSLKLGHKLFLAASQEIPRNSRNQKVHYRTHKRPPPVSILHQPNPVHIPTSHLLEIHPNIINPSTPRSPQWSPFLLFPHQDPIHPPLLTHMRHMLSPFHSVHFYWCEIFCVCVKLRDVLPNVPRPAPETNQP